MKKVLVILGFTTYTIFGLFLFNGCSQTVDGIIESGMSDIPEYYMEEWEYLNDFRSISMYIKEHVRYKSDRFFDSDGWLSNTQPPKKTMRLGTGDCEDLALLFMNIVKVGMGIEMEAVIVNSKDYTRTVECGGLGFNHVITRHMGVLYDPVLVYPVEADVCYSYTYSEVFR